MRLIKIETKGFKSFADKIVLNFDGGIVGIVGPNGSGKSNINDAIKWVLGERSMKSLRGDSSEDIIFSGSKTVPAMKKAEVSLTFDNSDGRVSIPHKQFTITRIVERGSGGNKYFINGEEARLKDIREIAMESGVGKSSLAIISQGTIQNIAQATADDRRLIFEEAAGISKYKARKNESLKKLDKTTESLEKVKTIVRELEKQRNPLKRQAEKAELYLTKKNKLEKVEIGLIAEDLDFFESKLHELNSELMTTLETKDNLTDRIDFTGNEIDEKNSYKLLLENEIHKLDIDFQKVSEELRKIDVASSIESQRRQMIIDGQISVNSESRLEAMKEEILELAQKVQNYKTSEEKAEKDINEKRQAIDFDRNKLNKMSFNIEHLKKKMLALQAKKTILVDYQENKSNLFKGTKTIVENAGLFPGFEGIIADLIKIDNKYKMAIETVLASSLQHVVVRTPDDAVKAVNFLKSNNGGRATFIPLATIKPKGIYDNHISVIRNQNGFLGIGSDLIDVKPQHTLLKSFLLGNVIFADNIENAKDISRILNQKYMVVTLDGDLIRAGGVISGGAKTKTKEILGIDGDLKKINEEVPKINDQIRLLNTDFSKLANIISENQALIAELKIENVKVNQKRQLFEKQFNDLKNQFEQDSEEELDIVTTTSEKHTLESQKISYQTLIKTKRDQVMSLNIELSSLTIEKTELEKALRDLLETSSEKMTQKNQAEYILKTSKERLANEYGMTFDAIRGQYALEIDREEAREIVSNIKSEIKELGHINLDAIDNYKEVNERYEKLVKAEEELLSAQQTIIAVIGEMDKIIIGNLDSLVKDVSKKMHQIFRTMFGGGMAEVTYTDPSNLLETGIEVIAQPPGKTIKNLKLFSGGEKALVAISLLFAILQSRPLPLCILDEVEAALDDTNVVRFANYLQELKGQTQFIVITHRVGTMARVNHLFGATMQTRGVTSFFTVRLADAEKLIKNDVKQNDTQKNEVK